MCKNTLFNRAFGGFDFAQDSYARQCEIFIRNYQEQTEKIKKEINEQYEAINKKSAADFIKYNLSPFPDDYLIRGIMKNKRESKFKTMRYIEAVRNYLNAHNKINNDYKKICMSIIANDIVFKKRILEKIKIKENK